MGTKLVDIHTSVLYVISHHHTHCLASARTSLAHNKFGFAACVRARAFNIKERIFFFNDDDDNDAVGRYPFCKP